MTSKYWSPVVSKLTPYVAGEQPLNPGVVKLNTNENPYPPSPRVLESIAQSTGDELRLYPDPNSQKLKRALAHHFELANDQIFVGNSSDEVLAHVFQALLKHDLPTLFPDVTYSFYPVYCGLYGIQYKTIPLTASFEIDLDDYAIPNGGIIFANPNAPTGVQLDTDLIEHFLKRHSESVVVIDEAYVDFGAESAARLIDRYPNVLVVQTFSKSRSLAGMRIGFALGNKDLIEGLERVKNSFNSYPLSRLANAAAVAAIEDREYFEAVTRNIVRSREELSAALRALGFQIIPSMANFVFASHSGHDAGFLYCRLKEQGVLVRHFSLPRIEQFLRITVGTPEQCESLLLALKAICLDECCSATLQGEK
ncbi:histidinol-phosphate transaminase [Verminephrobacter aporrectodeae subsp. tuberculatae]|uniref:Histidinol-phosphate aminotransferase n=1 Tax=Verminephrobacter aporrectodeae subsp. tuberculatae TaxID=1110392 RepID=A0ABT3KYN5_9BURK|nr:histidinol-phosphate transaminase [Verminephrobacter aporrectodeae]MCW5323014.1 histidinol-phosphate transaminase [Verminephrobacter aporrectodeae subsp. tuberculatae]